METQPITASTRGSGCERLALASDQLHHLQTKKKPRLRVIGSPSALGLHSSLH